MGLKERKKKDETETVSDFVLNGGRGVFKKKLEKFRFFPMDFCCLTHLYKGIGRGVMVETGLLKWVILVCFLELTITGEAAASANVLD